MPLPQIGLAWQPPPNLPIDQPGHGTRPGGMIPAMMTISLIQALIPSHPSNTVFHHDSPARERSIEGDILRRTLFAARFAARRRAQTLRMQFVNPNIRQIADA